MIKPCHRYSQPKPPTDSSFRVAVVSCTTSPIFNSLIQSPYCLPNYTQQTEWIQTSEESQFISGSPRQKDNYLPHESSLHLLCPLPLRFLGSTRTRAHRRGERVRLGESAHRLLTDSRRSSRGKRGLEIGPAPQPQDRLVGI